MNKLKLTGLSMLMLMAGACANDIKEPDPILTIDPVMLPEGPITDLTKVSVNNINDFAIELFKTTEQTFPGNTCISPTSVAAVLSMLANGDEGETRDELLTLLRFNTGSDGLNDLNTYNKILLLNLPSLDPATSFQFTNSFWYHPAYTVLVDFQNRITDAMFANTFNQCPGGEEGMNAINKFVESHTNGMIKNFIEEPLDITSAFLNTTYFKGEWTEPFNKEMTWERDFMNLDGSISKTDFMHREKVEYAETEDGTRAVRMPYGNGSFYMTAILPSENINHVPLLECLDNDNLKKLDDSFREEDRFMAFPKFEGNNNTNILDILKAMGLNKACDFGHGFHSIVDSDFPLVLIVFLHASKVIVDEAGTEGAAASLGGLVDAAYPGDVDPLKPIIFDRPFVYLIREKTSGTILFIGAVTAFS